MCISFSVSTAFLIGKVVCQIGGFNFHQTMHLGIVALAAFLSAISLIAYIRDRRIRLLYVCAAFLLFASKELLMFLNVLYSYEWYVIVPIIYAPLDHVLSFLILLLFAMGVLKR